MRELEVYVHIPFCVRKCGYCDFLSAPASESVRSAYMEQMQKEIAAAGPSYGKYQVSSVFIGGGTPSVLQPVQIRQLCRQLQDSFHILQDAEFTIECNPGTLDAEKLRTYRSCGVNRLSIGLQSADASELRLLGRMHTYEQFAGNYHLARELGFKNINVDLISALPGQKISVYEQTLKKVTALKPEHISAYSLIIEEGTPFSDRYGKAEQLRQKGKTQYLLPDEEEERRMYDLTKQLLESAGYHRYEISNYALTGYACRHNQGYWLRTNYLGIGLGASSLIENTRFSNVTDLNQYLKINMTERNRAVSTWEKLDVPAQMEEFMFLGLRMMSGVSAEKFQEQFSKTIEEVYGKVLDKQLKEGLIKRTNEGYCLTDYGIDISNYVMAQYLSG